MSAAAAAALLALLAASCSRNGAIPDSGLTKAPVAVPDERPAEEPLPREDAAASAPATAFDASGPEAAEAASEDEEFARPLEAPIDPDELAVSEDEVALLDELIALSLPEAPRVLTHEEELLHTRSELPLVMNEHVQRLINYFTKTTRGSATMRVSLGRGAAFRPRIERILEEEGVPAQIYYLAMAESGFRPKARSHAHATGMWQFISSRGKQYGLRQNEFGDLRYDAEYATRAAARHLKDLHVEFKDWYLAMAAYNCGPNRVKSAIRRTGSRDYWTLVRRGALPRETRNYVPIILAMTYVGENLDLFELGEIDPAPELRYDTVRTNERVSFQLVADATGATVETVKELNPALFQSATPPYAYDLRLPPGTAERFEREIALVEPGKRQEWRRYEVRQGETLQALAHRYKVQPDQIAALNSLPEGTQLAGGMRLTIPTKTKLSVYRYYGRRAGGLLEPGTGRYRIASGDTLGGIAGRFRTTVANLMAWNGLPSTRIRAGRYLIVQQPGTQSAAAPVASGSAPTGRYTVRRGDSLSAIGARVGASVSQLRAWNGIRSSTIHIGQTLKVPGPAAPAPAPKARTATASAAIPSSPVPAPSPNHYRIRSGDSLTVIAERFGVSAADLRAWNGMRGSRITAGKFLIVRPPSGSAAAAAGTTAGSSTHYTVRSGDTLGGIAERFGVTAAQLRSWNGIRGSTIHPGDRLAVRGGSGLAGIENYQIRRGDNLAVIAKRFNVTVADLKRWNGLRSSTIHPGKTLVIRSSGS